MRGGLVVVTVSLTLWVWWSGCLGDGSKGPAIGSSVLHDTRKVSGWNRHTLERHTKG